MYIITYVNRYAYESQPLTTLPKDKLQAVFGSQIQKNEKRNSPDYLYQ